MRVETVNQLAAKLGRPPTGLSALSQLDRNQIGLLDELIDAARARRRQEIDRALAAPVPAPLGRLLVAVVRRGVR